MGKTTSEAVTARQRARDNMARLLADRAARDKRIEDGTTDVLDSLDKVSALDSTFDAAVADAQAAYDAAVAKAKTARDRSAGNYDVKVSAAVAALRADGVSAADIADLTGLTRAEVTRRSAAATPAKTETDTTAAAASSVDRDTVATEPAPAAAAAPVGQGSSAA